MTELLKILILEDDPTDCSELLQNAKLTQNIEIIGCTANTKDALSLINSNLPNAVIIDLELHNGSGNGLQFLSDIKQLPLNPFPYLLVTTNNSSKITHEAARSLGADFILTKYESDYSAQYVMNFLSMMHNILSKKESEDRINSKATTHSPNYLTISDDSPISEFDIRQYIHENLNLVGISPKSIGYQYLTEAIYIKAENCQANIFSILGPRYKKSDASIERSMQYAINRAWRTSDTSDLLTYYTARIHSDRGVPTIMEFIYYYATKVRTYFKIQ